MMAYSAALLLLALPLAYAELPDMIVEMEAGSGTIDSGDPVQVTGAVFDHAYRPIAGADVLARSGAATVSTTTGGNGTFAVEFAGAERIAATHTINVMISWNNMTGFASTQFQVRGDASATSVLEEYLSSEEAKRYLGANASDFEGDPIGKRLFLHYEKLSGELAAKQKEAERTPEEIHAEMELRIAKEMRRDAIDKFSPSNGTYGGYQYDSYISRLSPQIRDLVADQLNFTKNMFENAQKIREAVIEAGGTYEEARTAYLDAVSVPREELEAFNRNATAGGLPGTR